MKFHLLAFGAAGFNGAGGNVLLPAIPEQAFSLSSQQTFTIPQPYNAFMAYAGGSGILASRFNTGSLRAKGYPQITPMGSTDQIIVTDSLMDFRNYPLYLRQEEDLRIDCTNGGAQDTLAVVGITPDPVNININNRDLRWLRFTAAVTAVAYAWSAPVTILFDDVLEGGQYGIYGLMVSEATALVCRLILQHEFLRPGCMGLAAMTDLNPNMFSGGLGEWGVFNYYSPPQLELIANASAAINIVGYLLAAKKGQ